ncbi:uncharacterized protein F4807DRAFT_417665 [Annulohypoxylon truncatum]|uniref:uncharacterized protein n=1 Tax=Annulohypoxylon truncatum TaxID=327061 RepID=UPI002007A9E4|nr:uncharacterized protein F4807DRAFT_417665 [Annulohypoxylon truncatum]KAI1212141.1 hypothetical protein F4807DRAFT_417665 [Annulohypoxylon truncatum]
MSPATTTAKQQTTFGERLSELTTVFTPPCPITWLLTTTKTPSQFPAFPTTGPSSCDPPSWVDNISQKGFAYYSPAICPSGFDVGCTANDDRIGEGFPPTSSGETAMYCVPSGFACTSDTTDFRGGIWGFSGSGPSVTVGPAIQIRWREEDLSSLQTDPLDPLDSSRPFDVTIESSVFSITETTLPTSSPPEITSVLFAPPAISTGTTASSTNSPITPTAIELPTSTSLLSSPSQLDTAVPIQTGTASTTSSENNPIPSANEGSSTNVASSTNTAAMALSGILIVIILGFLATVTFRRYRRYRAGKIEAFFPFQPTLWAKQVMGKWSSRSNPPHRSPGDLPAKVPDAELGTDGPIPELGPGDPLGTKDNPAELAGSGARNSWMSHVSRIFTGRLRKETWSV